MEQQLTFCIYLSLLIVKYLRIGKIFWNFECALWANRTVYNNGNPVKKMMSANNISNWVSTPSFQKSTAKNTIATKARVWTENRANKYGPKPVLSLWNISKRLRPIMRIFSGLNSKFSIFDINPVTTVPNNTKPTSDFEVRHTWITAHSIRMIFNLPANKKYT